MLLMIRTLFFTAFLFAHGALAADAPPSNNQAISRKASFPTKPKKYPEAERKIFKAACMNNNMAMYNFCGCIWQKFEETMTFQEFTEMNYLTEDVLQIYPPYVNAIRACAAAEGQ